VTLTERYDKSYSGIIKKIEKLGCNKPKSLNEKTFNNSPSFNWKSYYIYVRNKQQKLNI